MLFGEQLFLSATHLIVVVDVAALALAFGVVLTDTRVGTLRSQRASSVLVVAVVAHSHSVQWPTLVVASRNDSFLTT